MILTNFERFIGIMRSQKTLKNTCLKFSEHEARESTVCVANTGSIDRWEERTIRAIALNAHHSERAGTVGTLMG